VTKSKVDWLGLCVEMMSEYFSVEILSKADSEKYWSINQHILRVMEHTEPNRNRNASAELNERNALVKDFTRLFTMQNLNIEKPIMGDTGADEISDNVALNNLLLLSMIDD
jgi:hypothetical protein